MEEKLAEDIKRVLKIENVKIERSENMDYGDFSTNIALQNGRAGEQKNRNVSSGELAKKYVEKLSKDKQIKKYISKIEVAGLGFINFFLSEKFLFENLKEIVKKGKDYGRRDAGKGKTVIIDYSAPNIAKRFSVGHLRSTIIGQALYNIYNFLGWQTVGDNHLGDWGTQFGKLLYMIDIKKLDKSDLNIEKLEELYVEFHKEAEENPELESEARKWFKKLEDGDKKAREIWKKCVDVSIEEFETIYDALGVKIDNTYGESFYEEEMKKLSDLKKVKENLADGEGGAKVIDLTEFGIETPLMFEKSDGATTYAARDLATIKFRMGKWSNTELMIYEVGAEQSLHFKQVFAAAKKIGIVTDSVKFFHIGHGLYLDKNGKKFKTREGGTVKLEDVIEKAQEKALEIAEKNLSVSEAKKVAKKVGIGAIKYFDLSHNPSSNIVFDWDSIMNLEGNSGPYLQYTTARCKSVLARAEFSSINFQFPMNYSMEQLSKEEALLIRTFYRFSGVISDAAKSYSPNTLCNYLFNLAQRFNTFYNKQKIIGGEREKLGLAVTFATAQVLTNGLGLLGIQIPKRM